jgi:hypothetical protein
MRETRDNKDRKPMLPIQIKTLNISGRADGREEKSRDCIGGVLRVVEREEE